MKALSVLAMIIAAFSLFIGVILRIKPTTFFVGQIPPRSFLGFAAICLLFTIALSVYGIYTKK